MANVSNVSFRIDSDLKAQADALFSQLGMNMTTAFNIFLRQSVREGCIPFDIQSIRLMRILWLRFLKPSVCFAILILKHMMSRTL